MASFGIIDRIAGKGRVMNILDLIERHMNNMKKLWEEEDQAHEKLVKTIDKFCEEGKRERNAKSLVP